MQLKSAQSSHDAQRTKTLTTTKTARKEIVFRMRLNYIINSVATAISKMYNRVDDVLWILF